MTLLFLICFLIFGSCEAATPGNLKRRTTNLLKSDIPAPAQLSKEYYYGDGKDIPEFVQSSKLRAPGIPLTPPPPPTLQIPPPLQPTMQELGFGSKSFVETAARKVDKTNEKSSLENSAMPNSPTQDMFNSADTNNDGQLDMNEFQNAFQKMQQFMQQFQTMSPMMNGVGMPGMYGGGGMMMQPNTGYGYGAPAMMMNVPNLGYVGPGMPGFTVYPRPGSRPMSAHSPYAPYNFGGYDAHGFPLPHPGVPSSTPSPPTPPEGGAAAT